MKNIITGGLVALALVVASTGGAVAGTLITSHDIQDNTIKSRDLRDGKAVGEVDLKPALAAKVNQVGQIGPQGPAGPAGADGQDGATGPQGPAGADGQDGTDGQDGATGPQGPAGADGQDGQDGADGAPGLSEVRASEPYVTSIPAHSVGVVFTACPDGKAAISGGFRLNGFAAEAFQGGGGAVDVTAIASEPAGVVNGQLVNTYQNDAFPQNSDGDFLPNAWAVTVQNDSDNAQDVRAAVVCAFVG